MVVLSQVLRKLPVRFRPRVPVVLTPATITLTFASATTDAEAGVSAVAGATDAEQSFSFSEITPRTGLPIDLEISESSVLKLVVTFPDDYSGQAYTYTDTGGTPHAGTFPATNGTENF